jgi:general stress protein 26
MDTVDQNALRARVIEFLNAHRKAVFAVLDEQGLPVTSLMLYVIDDKLNVYFGTRKAFKKYGQMKAHPTVSLSVIEENVDPLKVVDIRGIVVELSPEEKEEAYSHFKSKNESKYYVEGADDYVMFKLTPNFVRWLDATSGELTITDLGSV